MKQIPLRSSDRGAPADESSQENRGWVAQDDYRMLSMAFTIKSMEDRFAESLRWHLAPFRLARPAPGGFPVELLIEEEEEGERPSYVFRFATLERVRTRILQEAVSRAVWEIHAAVHDRVRDFVLLHAGAVARGGQALLMPAKTASGKSSLTLGLLAAEFTYLCDDLGALDPVTGRAYPMPKRIKLVPDTLDFFPGLKERLEDRKAVPFRLWERFVRPEEVGARVAGPAAVRWLVFPTPDFGGSPRLLPMSKAASAEAMAANCFNLFRFGERGVVLLTRVAADAEAFRLVGGSLRERVDLLTDRLR